ncbi:methyltransferase domain-containing protein [bacterium]|nr:methyltransferase domain-containing protein [bacterium]
MSKHFRRLYHALVPLPVREWIHSRLHPDARLGRFFEHRDAVRACIEQAAREQWFRGTVLEIGTGRESQPREMFRRACPDVRFLGSDVSPAGYGRDGRPAPALHDLYCDVTALPFGRGVLDGILCSEVLEHVADYRVAIAEIARVLRPGGRVLITCPFLYPLHGPADYWRFTPQALDLLLRDEFRIVATRQVPLRRGSQTCPLNVSVLAERR